MRSRLAVSLLAAALATGGPRAAEQAPRRAPEEQARSGRALPEQRLRELPDDVFTPSEEVSEDHPVPFPVDI